MPGEGFKALADPTRRRILELLREGNCTAGSLLRISISASRRSAIIWRRSKTPGW